VCTCTAYGAALPCCTHDISGRRTLGGCTLHFGNMSEHCYCPMGPQVVATKCSRSTDIRNDEASVHSHVRRGCLQLLFAEEEVTQWRWLRQHAGGPPGSLLLCHAPTTASARRHVRPVQKAPRRTQPQCNIPSRQCTPLLADGQAPPKPILAASSCSSPVQSVDPGSGPKHSILLWQQPLPLFSLLKHSVQHKQSTAQQLYLPGTRLAVV
jgi:hypothetical protein